MVPAGRPGRERGGQEAPFRSPGDSGRDHQTCGERRARRYAEGGKRIYRQGHISRRCRQEIPRSEEHTSELQSHLNLVCRLLLEKKKTISQPFSANILTAKPR